jgi:hypothetical protein
MPFTVMLSPDVNSSWIAWIKKGPIRADNILLVNSGRAPITVTRRMSF